jgi:hypothetical protein
MGAFLIDRSTWNDPVNGNWSVKDIVAHLTG